MPENTPALLPVAFIYGDAEASAHLRAALDAFEADLVYDTAVDALDGAALADSGARVAVVNLDGPVDERLDEVYATLDAWGCPVIFDDPESSAALEGWEQARWARHLVAKLRDDRNVDPPRPADAAPVEPAATAPAAAAPVADDDWLGEALDVLQASDAGAADAMPAENVTTIDPTVDIDLGEIELAVEAEPDPAPAAADGAADAAAPLAAGPDPEPLLPESAESQPATAAGGASTAAAPPADDEAGDPALSIDWSLLDDDLALVAEPGAGAEAAAAAGESLELADSADDAGPDPDAADDDNGGPSFAEPQANTAAPDSDAGLDDLALDIDFAPALAATDDDASEGDAPADDAVAAFDLEFADALELVDDAQPAPAADADVAAGLDELLAARPESERPAGTADDADAADAGAAAAAPGDTAAATPPEPAASIADTIPSSQWTLVDDTDPPPAPAAAKDADGDAGRLPRALGSAVAESLAAREFSIELVDPIDYLAPEAPPPREAEVYSAPELMSLEDAVKPQPLAPDDDAEAADDAALLPRVVVMGASIGGPDAVREFLGALPADVPALFVLAQHMGDEFLDLMVSQMHKAGKLPVRLPVDGERAHAGEVLVVPAQARLSVRRDGKVSLTAVAADAAAQGQSLGATMAAAASEFGSDTLAIVFSGMVDDVIAGARAVAEEGGEVWTQDASSCVVSSMVDAISQAGIARFSGTPTMLARRLVDMCATESST
ncbi:MAG TPA: chemotaxis protein CheB [Rhodanobacteraceae bacterium]|nr:chemotaxis protein CheB [Rhodanobacteraceae bacterium]